MGIFSRGNSKAKGGGSLSQIVHDEKQKASIIVNTIDDAVILIDNENIIQNFNPAAETLTGWSRSEASGIDYRSVIKIRDEKGVPYEETKHPMFKVFQSKQQERDNTATLVRKDGTTASVDISVSPLIDEKGLISGAVGVLRNVEAQRKQERQRADFISTASHEMRTPVAAIEGYLALAMNDKVCTIDDKARNFLDKAHSSTSHLGQLFQDLLTSAKAEDGRLTSHPVVVELSEFVEKLVDDLRFSAEKKGLNLELLSSNNKTATGQTTISPLYHVNVDPDRLREVITNLFDNAVKYTDSGKISIGLTGDQEIVQFSITDTGPGIPKEDIPHLFQKFYRIDNSSTRTVGGTGLGLFICRKIIELYKGAIWVTSEVGSGSTFFINLPRISAKQAEKLRTEQQQSSQDISQVAST